LCGSRELHTGQWHPGEGTPMDVPEPSTVSFIGSFFGLTVVSLDMEKNVTPRKMPAIWILAAGA
jgi:hypothetical protein